MVGSEFGVNMKPQMLPVIVRAGVGVLVRGCDGVGGIIVAHLSTS